MGDRIGPEHAFPTLKTLRIRLTSIEMVAGPGFESDSFRARQYSTISWLFIFEAMRWAIGYLTIVRYAQLAVLRKGLLDFALYFSYSLTSSQKVTSL